MTDVPAVPTPDRGPAAAAGSEGLRPRLARHLPALARLAWPVMLSRAGILLMAFADIAMLGRYGVGAAGEAALGLAIFVPVLVFTIGLATGAVPVIARAEGAGERRETGRAWRRAVMFAGLASVIGAVVAFFTETWLALLGQSAGNAAGGGAVARMLAPGLMAQVLFAVSAFYLEATNRPLPALVVMAGANLANVALNWVLIYGQLGLPEMGAPGAALATTIVRFGALAAMLAVILGQRDARGSGVLDPQRSFWGPGGWAAGATMRRLGLSAAIAAGFETTGFGILNLFAGELGRLPLDAYAIGHNLVATGFMVGLGLSVATGVRVGQEIGRGRPHEAAFAGWCGMALGVVVMGAIAAVVLAARPTLAALYTDDPDLAAAVVALLAFSALVFVPDTLQVVAGQSVRALGDAWVAIGIYALAFAAVMIPLGYVMAFATPLAERGLPVAIALSCTLAFALLAWRFRVLTGRASER
ncbi:MAG: MATE family efflux transporter [Paracoccaceae bacterium]